MSAAVPADTPQTAGIKGESASGASAAHGPTPWRTAVATGAAAATPLLAYFGNLGFAPAVALAGLVSLPLLGRPRNPSRGLWLLIALLAWALVSEFWSVAAPRAPDFHRYKSVEALTGLKLVFELALYTSYVMAMRGISHSGGRLSGRVLGVGLAALAAFMMIESLTQAGLYQLVRTGFGFYIRPDLARRDVARACYVMALLFWPAALALWRSRYRALAYVLGAGAVLAPAILQVDAPIAAMTLSALVFLVVRRTGGAGVWVCLAATLAYFALAPLVIDLIGELGIGKHSIANVGKLSWGLRLQAWAFADRLILDRPLLGWGLDASRMWPKDIPLHPHDAALQLWLELGPLGAGLAALFFTWLYTRIGALWRTDRDMGAAACASVTAYLTIGALSFGVWQEWWLALGALAIGACVMVASGRAPDVKSVQDGELIPLI